MVKKFFKNTRKKYFIKIENLIVTSMQENNVYVTNNLKQKQSCYNDCDIGSYSVSNIHIIMFNSLKYLIYYVVIVFKFFI